MVDILIQIPNTKQTYIINSNTMTELPPLLDQLQKSISQIDKFAIKNNLKLKVIEVKT